MKSESFTLSFSCPVAAQLLPKETFRLRNENCTIDMVPTCPRLGHAFTGTCGPIVVSPFCGLILSAYRSSVVMFGSVKPGFG